MSKISLVLILMLFAGRLSAQQDYFIFFQADNNQPFYVLRADKSYSSSAQGHLILAPLKEGVVTIKVGWPGKKWPEQAYTLSVKSDLEYQLKNLGEKGWQLFNPQTLELKAPDKTDAAADGGLNKEGVKKDDAFSRMMAGVVSDTAVMYNTYAMDKVLKEAPVATTVSYAVAVDTAAATVKTDVVIDTAVAVVDTTLKQGVAGLPAAERLSATKNLVKVKKISEKKGTKQWRGVYTDGVGKKSDTIVVIIPNDTVVRVVRAVKMVDTAKKVQAVTFNELVKADTTAAEKKGVTPAEGVEKGNMTAEKAAVEVTEKKVVSVAPEKAKVTVVNSDCKNFATDYDLDKLRVKMLEASKDDDRIVYAKKIFKTKCFTTRQIRALSEVFVSDGQKYRFFETAYPFVSDDRFSELASLLADPVYNSKFKAMTGQ